MYSVFFRILLSVFVCYSLISQSEQVTHKKTWRGRHLVGGFLGAKTMEERKPAPGSSVTIDYFDMPLDHFNHEDTRTFKNKYWTNTNFYKAGGPIFIFLGGEGPTSRHWIDTNDGVPDYLKNAMTFNALCFQLEHRFYGDSHPTNDTSVENLRYLSSVQALADIASFAEGMRAKFKIPNAKVITVGGSYSGAMSAWFRLKYPHVAVGAIASSGPVFAEENFVEYLEVVQDSLKTSSIDCLYNIADATKTIENLYMSGDSSQIAKFESNLGLCSSLNQSNSLDVSNFYQSLAGAVMGIVQYSEDNRGAAANNLTVPHACQIMTDPSEPDNLQRYINLQKLVMAVDGESCFDTDYGAMIKYLQDDTWNGDASRTWIWQTCTEFGYFQSSDSDKQPFGKRFDGRFSQRMCSDVFGPKFTYEFTQAAIDWTNTYYGGRDLKATNVILPNGSIDPWHALGILKTETSSAPAVFITGTAHCANMYPPRAADLPELIMARRVITDTIATWLQE